MPYTIHTRRRDSCGQRWLTDESEQCPVCVDSPISKSLSRSAIAITTKEKGHTVRRCRDPHLPTGFFNTRVK